MHPRPPTRPVRRMPGQPLMFCHTAARGLLYEWAMKKDPKATHAASLRDGAGHLNAEVAADLLARSRDEGDAPADDRAFFRAARTSDSLAEHMGEGFVAAATSGEEADDETAEEVEAEEAGGPFVETTGKTEFAGGTDPSNPRDATREPFPTT